MTQLLVVRHGRAQDADAFAATGRSDDERPLTDDGAREMKQAADGLKELVKRIDMIVPSPLVRARQTAEILAGAFAMTVENPIDELRPESPFTSFEGWAARRESPILAIVGHAPHLGTLVAWLMSGVDREAVALKKGGACLLEFEGAPKRGAGVLQWLLTSKQLRRQGET